MTMWKDNEKKIFSSIFWFLLKKSQLFYLNMNMHMQIIS